MTGLFVHLLPALVAEEALAGATVVVIDVLRASTTITHALAAGAAEVIPCGEIEEARRWAGEACLLGGERLGLPIEGFDLGNSPREYRADVVAGRRIAFTTTNGTRAIERCRLAREVLIGGFVNAGAVARRLVGRETAHLLCAGTRGGVTREDTLLAGYLIERVAREMSPLSVTADEELARTRELCQNDEARLAWGAWREAALRLAAPGEEVSRAELACELHNTQGGRNLMAIGLAGDIADAAAIDAFELIPEWSAEDRSLRVAR